jgi:hypothetical protein
MLANSPSAQKPVDLRLVEEPHSGISAMWLRIRSPRTPPKGRELAQPFECPNQTRARAVHHSPKRFHWLYVAKPFVFSGIPDEF